MKPSLDLLDVLKQLPDSLRENPFGEKQGLELNATEMDRLIEQGVLEMPQGYRWRLEFADTARTLLKLIREGTEEGLRYELLSLKSPTSEAWVLVLQGLEDHCCGYSRWALFQVVKGSLVDRTKEKMMRLTWNDFFSDHALGDSPPPQLVENRYPLIMDLEASPPQILIGMSPDYLELNYAEEQISGMLANMPAWPKKLVWEGERFVWAEEK